MRKKVYITASTHWDREWVMTQGQYQVRLVNLINRLLPMLESDPEYKFLLDGQAIALEDYLEIHPENTERVRKLLKSGQLCAGPWYVLADQFMENAEATVRNLQMGMDYMKKLDGSPMMLGYIPDSFGSIASLPLFLNEFGIKYVMVAHGVPNGTEELPFFEMEWQSGNNSSVTLSKHHYSEGVFLTYSDIWCDIFDLPPSDLPALKERFISAMRGQEPHTVLDSLFLSVAIDHMEPKKNLTEILRYINENQDEYEAVLTFPDDYMQSSKRVRDLPVYKGEMREPVMAARLAGTLSSRIKLKQQNSKCELLIERLLEPLLTVADAFAGLPYPKGMMKKLWKLLLASHAHDSVTGCGIDEVSADILIRYREIESIGNYLLKDALRALTAAINTESFDADAAITVFNPSGGSLGAHPVKGLVCIPGRIDLSGLTLTDENGTPIPCVLRSLAQKDKDLESVYMTNDRLAMVLSKDSPAERAGNQVFTVLEAEAIVSNIPATGWRTYSLKKVQQASDTVKSWNNGMENSRIKVEFSANGDICMTDKDTGKAYENLQYFADRADAGMGGLYGHKGFETADNFTTLNISPIWKLHESNPCHVTFKTEYDWLLPSDSTDESRFEKLCPVKITQYVTLHGDVKRLEFKTEIDNTCKNHFLRTVFKTGIKTDVNNSYCHFNITERPVRTQGLIWQDFPFQEFVDISDGEHGLCLASKGLPGYEAVSDESGVLLYLSLLRCVGRIGEAAGADYPVPDGQCPGHHVFEYALIPHAGSLSDSDCLNAAMNYRTPPVMEGATIHKGTLPPKAAFTSAFEEEGLLFSCLKPAENGEGVILRLWNSCDKRAVKLDGSFPFSGITPVHFNEEPSGKPLTGNTAELDELGVVSFKLI